MATAAVEFAMSVEEERNLHPFFSKAHRNDHTPENVCNQEAFSKEGEPANNGPVVSEFEEAKAEIIPRKSKGKGKPKKSKLGALTNQKPLSFFVHPQAGATQGESTEEGPVSCDASADTLVDDPNLERRKRIKLTPPSGYMNESALMKDCEPAASSSHHPQTRTEQLWTEADHDLGDINTSGTTASDEPEQEDATAMEANVPPSTPPDPIEAIESGHAVLSPDLLSVEHVHTSLDSASVSVEPQRDMRPRKMLRLKGNGKFSSPPQNSSSDKPKTTKRGRLKKAEKRLLMAWKYPHRVDFTVFGQRIERILNGSERVPHPTTPVEQPKLLTKEQTGPPKPTHPFFLGKATLGEHTKRKLEEVGASTKREYNEEKPRTPRKVTGTPAKLRAQAQAQRAANESSSLPSFGTVMKRAAFIKHPGAHDAPWPNSENTHVRGISNPIHRPVLPDNDSLFIGHQKKCKSNAIVISDKEDVMMNGVERLFLKRSRIYHHEGTENTDYPPVLRKPDRRLISGPELEEKISKELVAQPEWEENGMAGTKTSQARSMKLHAASQKIYSSIKEYLTPFDRFQCESQLWVQKYAPQRAEEVLQPGREAILLRDWLRKCTISAVDTGSKNSVASFEGVVTKKAPVKCVKKKRRKRNEDLNDFIVSSDDDGEELEELLDLEHEQYSLSVHSGTRSLVRGGIDNLQSGQSMKKVGSTILLSGPHGCGKTAAVYAIAKELGFEVFEINPGSRRSGKDVLDRIGDMTENHLVQQVSKALSESKCEDGMEPIDVKPATEEPDRKQKSMACFFKPLAKKTSDQIGKEAPVKARKEETKSTKPRPPHQQKQSLILFEEVDVLFEEDKNFWLTILTLAKHSKRPIILTCNDENLVPLEALTLHAILRFNAVPSELAVDFLLLLVAREGHQLNRRAVETLYQSVDDDLRASIMELNFWCQMGVGADNCLEWLFQRWPPGSDVDKHGRTIRVVSKDTYLPGIGWYVRDTMCSTYDRSDAEYLALLEARKDWGVSDEDLHATTGILTDLSDGSYQQCMASGSLLDFEIYSESLSAADIYCGLNKKTDGNHQAVDSSLPELSDSAKANYIIGWPLLEADPPPEYIDLDNQLACSALTLTRNTSTSVQSEARKLSSSIDQHLISAILNAQSRQHSKPRLTRKDFSLALDILAEPCSSQQPSSSSLTASSLDREFSVVTTDVAPYIRNIAAYDLMLEEERLRLSDLLSAGGRSKRMRTTRAARSALEGGRRETTRRERWFDRSLNLRLALETGGKTWAGIGGKADAKRFDDVEADARSTKSGDDEMEG